MLERIPMRFTFGQYNQTMFKHTKKKWKKECERETENRQFSLKNPTVLYLINFEFENNYKAILWFWIWKLNKEGKQKLCHKLWENQWKRRGMEADRCRFRQKWYAAIVLIVESQVASCGRWTWQIALSW